MVRYRSCRLRHGQKTWPAVAACSNLMAAETAAEAATVAAADAAETATVGSSSGSRSSREAELVARAPRSTSLEVGKLGTSAQTNDSTGDRCDRTMMEPSTCFSSRHPATVPGVRHPRYNLLDATFGM